MANWKAGDVVQLKSGGPKMTVSVVEQGSIYCVWFAGTEQKGKSFAPETLEAVQSQAGQHQAGGREPGPWS